MKNVTSDKGDIAVAKVISELTNHGCYISLPFGAHLPYDIIVADAGHKLSKVQVKYSSMYKGCIPVKLTTTHSNRQGNVFKLINPDYIDAFAVWCPDTENVYYIHINEMKGKSVFYLRVIPPANNQYERVNMAENYMNHNVIF